MWVLILNSYMRNTGLAGIMYATKLICEKAQRSLQRRMTTTFMTLDRKWNSRKSVRSGSLTCTTEVDDVKVGHKSRVAGIMGPKGCSSRNLGGTFTIIFLQHRVTFHNDCPRSTSDFTHCCLCVA
jgi:hypothetical protein